MLGPYQLFDQRTFLDRLATLLAPIRDTLREAIQLEDYEEGGQVTVSSLRDALEGLQLAGLEGELLDFAVFWGYSRGGEDLQAVRYQVLLDAVDGQAGKGANAGEGRKRPESSSPAQLKARNKEKYSLEGSGNAKGSGEKEERSPEGAADEEEEEDYKEEQFEQMLDKDDDENGADESAEKSPASQRKKDEFIDEDKMLDIAEKCFMRIAEAIIT